VLKPISLEDDSAMRLRPCWVQRLLGHATATMTLDRYGHLYPDDLDDVAQQLASECVYPVRTGAE
jgi:integrase